MKNTWEVLKCGVGEGWRRSAEVLHRVKTERDMLLKIKRWKANWIGYILRRNCLLNTSLK
jgi:hypothetical protein